MVFHKIVFSPTGGTEKTADVIFSQISDEAVKTDLCINNFSHKNIPSISQNDVCMVAVPSFGGRVPSAAASRLRMLKGNGAVAFALVVYGNRAYEDTLAELYDILSEAGFRVKGAAAAIAEHSIFHSFANGRPDHNDIEKLKKIGQKFSETLSSAGILRPEAVCGNRPYKQLSLIKMIPVTTELCTGCGLCWNLCPVGAIPQNDPSNTDKNLCISCMRCVSVCRYKARTVPEDILKNGEERLKKLCADRKEPELFT